LTLPRINVVFDFDSTLATTFVGGLMFRGHVPDEQLAQAQERYEAEVTTLRKYQEEVFDLIDDTPDNMSQRAADAATIRPLAREVIDLVRYQGGSVAVASAGLDVYIAPVLEKAGLDKIEIHSGRIVSEPTKLPPFRYDYPSAGKSCKGDWVTCKCEVIDSLKKTNEDEVVFVGDGSTSDRCAATNAADTVFATGRLLAICREKNIPATEFSDDFGPLLSYVGDKTSANGDQ
jgi:2,3-diketo-5-methylthio-1-phosphopentane phosphatase